MSGFLTRLWRDQRGGPAAEFVLVLPLLILFLFGIIDVGRLMWEWNKAEKATMMGVRQAVVVNPVASGLASYSYAVSGGIPQGDPIPQSGFGGISCTSTACACLSEGGGSCPFGTGRDGTAFNTILAQMQAMKNDITPADVVIAYRWSGLGYAGDPNGPDVAPLVTVSLRNLQFQPMILFGAVNLDLPGFGATLTMEGGGSTTS